MSGCQCNDCTIVRAHNVPAEHFWTPEEQHYYHENILEGLGLEAHFHHKQDLSARPVVVHHHAHYPHQRCHGPIRAPAGTAPALYEHQTVTAVGHPHVHHHHTNVVVTKTQPEKTEGWYVPAGQKPNAGARGRILHVGRTPEQIRADEHYKATRFGAYAPREVAPADPKPDDLFLVMTKTGKEATRRYATIMNAMGEGKWEMWPGGQMVWRQKA